jgi:hypothetical protein
MNETERWEPSPIPITVLIRNPEAKEQAERWRASHRRREITRDFVWRAHPTPRYLYPILAERGIEPIKEQRHG